MGLDSTYYNTWMFNQPNGGYNPCWNFTNYGGTYGGFNNYNFGWGGGISASSSSSSSSSEDAYFKALEKNKDNEAKAAEQRKKIEDKAKEIAELEKQRAELKANEQADGSVSKKKKLSSRGFFSNLFGAVSGMVTGVFKTVANAVKSIAGFDENGKWSLKRMLVGVGTVAAVALCCTPAAAAIVPALAFTAPTLACVGIGMGCYQVGKGCVQVCKAIKHDSVDEFQAGFENIGGGAAIAAASYAGYKASGGFSAAKANYNNAVSLKAQGYSLGERITLQKQFVNTNAIKASEAKQVEMRRDINDSLKKNIADLDEQIARLPDGETKSALAARRDALDLELKNFGRASMGDKVGLEKAGTSIGEYKEGWFKSRTPWSKNSKTLNSELNNLDKLLGQFKRERLSYMKMLARGTDAEKALASQFGLDVKKIGTLEYKIASLRSSLRTKAKSYFSLKGLFKGIFDYMLLKTDSAMLIGQAAKPQLYAYATPHIAYANAIKPYGYDGKESSGLYDMAAAVGFVDSSYDNITLDLPVAQDENGNIIRQKQEVPAFIPAENVEAIYADLKTQEDVIRKELEKLNKELKNYTA